MNLIETTKHKPKKIMFGRIKSVFYNYLLQKNSLHLKNTNVDIMPVIRKNYNARAVSITDG